MTYSILVADDEPHVLEAIKSVLEQEGYRVSGVTNGCAVLEEAARAATDLIILDETLPDLGYEEVILRLRNGAASAGRPEPPILFMLSRATLERLGCGSHIYSVLFSAPHRQSFPDRVLLKPFSPEFLKQIVASMLSHPQNTWR